MSTGHTYANLADLTYRLVRYNLKIVFANKFIYFFAAAVAVFLVFTALIIFNANSRPDEGTIYWLLLVPGLLIVFYPATFGIQNDVDTRMLEILFGVPNYRYKVWLVRLLIMFAVSAAIVAALGFLSTFALTSVPILPMTFQLMIPIAFFAGLAFLVSTLVRSGGGTAVVLVIVGIVLWFSRSFFESHRKWDVFLNPFAMPENANAQLWADIVVQNRLILVFGIVVTIVAALLNLQNREKFLM